ncbi:hypothetical protein E7811_11030 [Aliigemmobacter aestuarii]|uniref:Uncharacterized protein n=1 Tax=Aliigemmobacter aestuarii TaxID=1445661 RepID=A0A4S3MP12_9RHOB|nr:hypothetical protein [Gemmobacter aestuarii]THD83784.1 hypothetical protein E7811_11030 [Gemmobacter aestuarii]
MTSTQNRAQPAITIRRNVLPDAEANQAAQREYVVVRCVLMSIFGCHNPEGAVKILLRARPVPVNKAESRWQDCAETGGSSGDFRRCA